MRFNSTISLVLGFLLALIAMSESKDFCKEFSRHNYNITLGYRHMTIDNKYLDYLFIGQDYWKLKYKDNADDDKKTVKLEDDSDGMSDWFGQQFSMGFCFWYLNRSSCITGLLNQAKNEISWNQLDSNLNVIPNTSESSAINLTYVKGAQPFSAYSPVWGQDLHWNVVFLYRPTKYRVFRILGDYSQIDVNDLTPEERADVKPIALNGWEPVYPVMAIFGQYSYADYEAKGGPTNNWGQGMIVLFRKGQTIRYCYSDSHYLSDSCKNKNWKTLIDCSPDSIARKNALNPFVVIGIVVIVVILVLALVFIYFKSILAKGSVDEKKSEPKLKTESKLKKPESEPKKPELEPESKLKPEPESELKKTEPESEPKKSEPETEPKKTEPESELKKTEPESEPKKSEPESELKKTKPESEPKKSEPEAELKKTEPESELKKSEPEAELKKTEPESELKKSEPEAELKKTEPESEPKKSEPEAELKKTEPESELKKSEPEAEPKKTEPESEPKLKTELESEPKLKTESESEPNP